MELVKNIFFNTDKIVEGDTVKISYVGYLFQNGSKDVYLHYGYGDNWNNIGEVKTEKTELGYQAEITIPHGYTTLNLCYKNENDEWDNNIGGNYIFNIEPCAETTVETEVGTVTYTGIETETGIGTEADLEIGTGIETGVDVDYYTTEVETNNTSTNTYSVYDILGTTTDGTDVTVETSRTTDNTETTGGDTYLSVTKETGMQMHKGLRKTYLWSKKIKLAIYKIIKYVPKIISGNYKRKVND